MATLTHAPLGTLRPGSLSPHRHVPAGIERPEYVGRAEAQEPMPGETPAKDAATVERIARASRIAADTLVAVAEVIAPGVTTDEIDRVGHDYMVAQGAYPSTLGYKGYPKSLCTSVNEVICHGIPDDVTLRDGDIVNVDVTAFVDGVHGDTNYTFLVGDVDEESRQLVARTYQAMMRGIKAVKPGRRIPVIGRVIESYAKRFGYGVVRDFTGHGVGESFHSGLVVPHYDSAPQYDTLIEEGMVFTIEPMLTLGSIDWEMWDNGWTVVTRDRRRTAQFEHTLVVRADGAEILTLPSGTPLVPPA